MTLESKNLFNIILDHNQIKKPELYTVKQIDDNIYHSVDDSEYLAFRRDKNDASLSSVDRNNNISKFKNFLFSNWLSENHIDLYITGSVQSLSKFDLICGGSLNKKIPFNINSNQSKSIKIRNAEFKMRRISEEFIWENTTDIEKDMKFSINKLKTNGFKYNILTINSTNNFNNINFLD